MKAVAAVLLVLMLAGCNLFDEHSKWFNQINAGTVHGRDFTPAHWVSGTTSCSGNPMICSTSPGYMAPDAWSLDLYANNGDHGWTEISEQAYDRCAVQQQYPDCSWG